MPHHNTGKRHAAKLDDEKKTSTLHIRCTKEQKTLFDRASGNKRLSSWVIATLTQAAREAVKL